MDRIQAQATRLWELIFHSETSATYSKALQLTWNILKESAQLLWLIFCLVFVLAAWLGNYAIAIGRNLRNWYNGLEDPKANSLFAALGETLVSVGENSAAYAFSQAKDQLGLELPPPPKAIAGTTPAAPKAATPAAATPATPVAPAAPPVETAKPTTLVEDDTTDLE